MISPELLRRYPFFGALDDSQLKTVAIHSSELTFKDGELIFEEAEPAQALYLLAEGSVDIYYTIETAYWPQDRREVTVFQVAAGQLFGISALIEPYRLISGARSCGSSRAIRIEASALRTLFAQDSRLEGLMLHRAAEAVMERLHATRTLLAVAYAGAR